MPTTLSLHVHTHIYMYICNICCIYIMGNIYVETDGDFIEEIEIQ